MKKITYFLAIFMALLFSNSLYAAQVPSYIVNETFDGLSTYPTGWTNGTPNYFGYNGTATIGSGVLNVSGSGSGTRGKRTNFTSSGTETSVYVDFDLLVNSSTIGYKNAFGLVIDGTGSNTASPKSIFCLYAAGTDGKFHYANADLDTVAFNTDDTWGASFRRAGTSNALTDALNLGTQINFGFSLGVTYNIKALLNFTTQKVESLVITNLSNDSKIELGEYPFMRYSSSITDVNSISLFNTRGSNEGNGSNSNINASIDNFKTYTMIDATLANVTINYLDPSNNPIKTARVAADNIIGSTYTALADDKATIVSGGFYYVYDAASTTADNVVVLADGTAAINLKFTKNAVTSGTYTWTGSSSANWNELETNFSTDGNNSVGYQFGNAVVFNGSGANKSVSLNNDFDLGSNNVTISGDGYSLSGSGKLTGSGKIILNTTGTETTTINIINELTGGVEVNGGIAVISNDAAAASITAANGSTLNLSTGANFSKAIVGTGTVNIIPTSNVTYTSAITGASQLNYLLVAEGSVNTTSIYNIPKLNNSFSGQINVGTELASAYFGFTTTQTNAKIALGDNISLVYNENPASSGSYISIGELTGTGLSKLMGNRIGRAVTYTIGGLNTDFTFAGTIENFGPDAWAGIPITNLTKAGTGTMTLTGNSTAYTTGSVVVSAGKLNVNGTLGTTTVPVTVDADGTLGGNGTIGGATLVNGTLEGSLSFGSTLTLAGTTKITVNGFGTGEYDVISVNGGVTFGGVLNVTVNASAPANGTSIKIVDAATYGGDFTQPITAPAGYSFNTTTGMLTYSAATALDNAVNSNIKVYMANEKAVIDGINAGETFTVYNAMGAVVLSAKATSSKVEVNLPSRGLYLIKTLNTTFKLIK